MVPIDVLLVEDSIADARLFEETIKDNANPIHINNAYDGIEALDYLYKRNGYEDKVTPDLILLDLNMPRVDGFEVLKTIKSDDVLKQIPVIVLSSSQSDEDIAKSYLCYANSYINKTVDFNEFSEIVNGLEQYWLKISKLPAKNKCM